MKFRESGLIRYRIELETITCRASRSGSTDKLYGALMARIGRSHAEVSGYIGELASGEKIKPQMVVDVSHQYNSKDLLRVAICAANGASDEEYAVQAAQTSAAALFSTSSEERDDIRFGQSRLRDAIPSFFKSQNGLVLWMYYEIAVGDIVVAADNDEPWCITGSQPGFNGLDDWTRRSDYSYELGVHL